MDDRDFYAIVMAGGRGERFWPLGRRQRPKQLLKLTGEKTMLDALIPAHDAYCEAVAAGADMVAALDKACEAAREGVEFTKTIRATKGRASYLGDRSIGHQDPGATSATLTLEAIRDFLKA